VEFYHVSFKQIEWEKRREGERHASFLSLPFWAITTNY
jgi:hypothetical protein